MAREYLLAVAGLCLLGAAVIGLRELRRPGYEPRHTAEQPRVAAEHTGATEEWTPLADIGKPKPVDVHVKLANAEAQLEYWQRQVDRYRAVVAAEEAQPLTRALAELHARFVDQLSRTGRQVHLEVDTEQWSRADIRRIVRSGAPR